MNELGNAWERTGDESDEQVETAEWVVEPLFVKELLQEMKNRHEQFEHATFMNARLNECYVGGRQNVSLDEAGDYEDITEHGEVAPTRNIMRNIVLTYAARINEDRPSVKAWPADASLLDKAVTDVANAIIRHQYTVQDIDAMMARAAKLAQMHGCVGFKIAWDPKAGRTVLDPVRGPIVLGEVSIDLVTVFDYLTDGSEHVRDSKYVVFKHMIDWHDAKQMCVDAGKEEDPQKDSPEDIWGTARSDMCELREIWHKPCARIPNGLYAVVVGGVVVETRDYPYIHRELPIAVWKLGSRREHPHGDTHLTDVRKIQDAINDSLRVRQDLYEAFGRAVKFFAPQAVLDEMEAANQMVANEGIELSKIGFVEPPKVALDSLYDQADREEEAAHRVSGLNEALYASENAKNTSGVAIHYLKELDSQKLSEASRNQGECLRRIFRQTLRLYQQYVTEERTIHIAGEENAMEVKTFKGADVEGVDIVLEPVSGTTNFRSAMIAEMDERAAAGLMDPARVEQLRETGLPQTAPEQWQRTRVHEQIGAALQGQVTPPDPNVDPKIAMEEITMVMGLRPDAVDVLLQLRAGYQQNAQAAAMSQMRGQGPQAQGARPRPRQINQAPETPAGLPMKPAGGF